MARKPDKKVKWAGITFYERRTVADTTGHYVLGIPIVWRTVNDMGVRKYFMGICYRYKKAKPGTWRAKPPELSLESAVKRRHMEPKEILIIPGPGIGDYIITRNFIAEIKNSERYKDHKIVLLCEDRFVAFAKYLDSDRIDKFLLFSEHIPYKVAPNYKLTERVRRNLIQHGLASYYDSIVYLCNIYNGKYGRIIRNHLTHHVASRERITFCYMGRKENAGEYRYMSRVVPGMYHFHEKWVFDVHKDFFGEMLEKTFTWKHPFIESDKIVGNSPVSGRYIVINPCSSPENAQNMWHRNNWVELLIRVGRNEQIPIVLICGKGQLDYTQRISDELRADGVESQVMAGLPIAELLSLLYHAEIFVGLDSAIFHVAAALNRPKACCISSGYDYVRFLSGYEDRTESIRVVCAHGWKEWFLHQLSKEARLAWPNETHPINMVSVGDVYHAIHELLSNKG